jgi:hypothetical protein
VLALSQTSSSGPSALSIGALLLSTLALLFTVGSFWWMNLRRGCLLAWGPLNYAGFLEAERVRLTVPLVIENTGPRTLVVRDLRLLAEEVPLTSTNLRGALYGPDFHEVLDHPSGFAVQGRSTVKLFAEFGRDDNRADLKPEQRVALELQVRVGRRGLRRLLVRRTWDRLACFDLVMMDDETRNLYIAHAGEGRPTIPDFG